MKSRLVTTQGIKDLEGSKSPTLNLFPGSGFLGLGLGMSGCTFILALGEMFGLQG